MFLPPEMRIFGFYARVRAPYFKLNALPVKLH